MVFALDYHFTLNSFKITWKSFDFSVKILNFLWRTPLYSVYWIIRFCLEGCRPANFRIKLKWQEENLGKISNVHKPRGRLCPPKPPCRREFFNYSYIFVQVRTENSWNFENWLTFLSLYYRFRQISWGIFYRRGGGPPEPPIIPCPYYIPFSHN